MRKSRLLLIDDDSDDRELFATALEKTGLDVDVSEMADGSTALDYLLGKQPYNDQAKYPYPDLIFLDLKMPDMDGFELLKQIRKSIGAQSLPIIVFTNSHSIKDVRAAYSLQASAFHQKPFKLDDLVTLLQMTIPLWLGTSSSPSTVTAGIRRFCPDKGRYCPDSDRICPGQPEYCPSGQ